MTKKAFLKLSIADIEKYPVWEFSSDGRTVAPSQELSITSLAGRAIGVQVALANGQLNWAILTNLSLQSPHYNHHLVSVRLDVSGTWFDLGRYFDADYKDRTPAIFAQRMGLSIDEVFPIYYDLSSIVEGAKDVVSSHIPALVEPQLPLSELMKLVVKKYALKK